jgi:hypothetical protein
LASAIARKPEPALPNELVVEALFRDVTFSADPRLQPDVRLGLSTSSTPPVALQNDRAGGVDIRHQLLRVRVAAIGMEALARAK